MKTRIHSTHPTRSGLARSGALALAMSVVMLGACSSDNDDDGGDQEVPVEDGGQTDGNTDGSADGSDNGGDGGSGDGAGSEIRTLSIDASAGGFGAATDDPANKWTYVDLDDGQVIELSDEQASTDTTWDVAFKRTAVRTNGGVSGPGSVTAAVADAQLDFYDENGDPDADVFKAATAESELASLQADIDTDLLSFEGDADVAAIDGGGLDEASSWWLYNPSDHSVNPNPDVWYIVRGADGESYARMRVTDIQQADRQITAELFIQNPGETAFSETAAAWTAVIGNDGLNACYDFEQMMDVDCTAQADSWDLQFEVSGGGRSWNAWVNGGEIRGAGSEGAAFGPLSNDMIGDYASASAIPHFAADAAGGVFESNSWYAYDLDGNHQIWPNYRVYVLDTGEALHRLQILGYYDDAGASGFITLRHGALD